MSPHISVGSLLLCILLSHTGALKVSSPSGSNIYAVNGSDFTIRCEVTPGDQNTVVRWYRDDVPIDSNTNTGFITEAKIEGDVIKATLIKENVVDEDAGTYKCEVFGTTEHTLVHVKVSENRERQHKRAITNPINITVRLHHAHVQGPKNDTHITCEVLGSLGVGVYDLKWYKGDQQIENKDDKYILKPENNTLVIQRVVFNDDLGEYKCVFELNDGQSMNRTVYVYGSAHVKAFEKSKNLVEDDSLNIECVASGWPLPAVNWYFEESMLNHSDRVRFTTGQNSLVENSTLRISSMQYADAGEYTCEAENEINGMANTNNQTITVRVKDKLAALWPFLGICVEVTVLCIIIFIYEKRRQKRMAEEEAKEEASHLTNSHANTADVRQRKV